MKKTIIILIILLLVGLLFGCTEIDNDPDGPPIQITKYNPALTGTWINQQSNYTNEFIFDGKGNFETATNYETARDVIQGKYQTQDNLIILTNFSNLANDRNMKYLIDRNELTVTPLNKSKPLTFTKKGTTSIDIDPPNQDINFAQVLVIGIPSTGERVVLDNLSYLLTYQTRDATSFDNNVSNELQQYDIVILDQSISSDKSVTVSLGEAIQKYVDKGGKLILVMNSGVRQSVGFGSTTTIDAIGWKANFGNTMPAECVLNQTGKPSCEKGQEISSIGRIYRQDYDHPIMLGTEVSPALNEAPYAMTTLAVQANEGAKTIAYIKAENTPQTYPAILEKKNFPLGNVIYFNYDPGLTPSVFKNTIMYLK